MKKISAFAIAAVLSLGAPAMVFAQATPQTLAPGTASPAVQNNSAGATSFDQFIENIGNTDFTSALDILDRANSVSVIKVSAMANANADSLNKALGPHASDLDLLHSRVSSNTKAMQALKGAGVSADQVVGIDASGDGSVTLYVNDMAS